jgi:hypothetical protein
MSLFHQYHQYPSLDLFHDQTDDSTSLSYPQSLSASTRWTLSATPSTSSYGIEEGLQSPSLLPATSGFQLFLLFRPFTFDHSGFSCSEVPPPLGISQRTTWHSLPGADTDDDLILAELGLKTYIPDPSVTIPTTLPSRSLLIWIPLPALIYLQVFRHLMEQVILLIDSMLMPFR